MKNRKERNKEMKRINMKRLICRILVLSVLSLSLFGCGEAEQEPETESDISNSNIEIPEAEEETDMKPDAEQNHVTAFPEDFSGTMENVTFNMDIIIDADLTENSVVTAKAQMQKVNHEKAFQLFFSDIEKYETYDYEEEDEYRKLVQQVTYVSPEETTLAYGPLSSKFDYMKRDLVPYVLNAFVPFQDERYNADLYSLEEQLPFMTREEAFEMIHNALKEIDIEIENDYTCYALDHETMQSQEYYEDMDGNIDKTQYKAQWSDADDCYYFYINQTYKGLPMYHVYNEVFEEAEDINAPVQAIVSEEGIEWLNIEKVFEISDEKGVSLADMDTVVKTAADKYNQISGDAAYEMTKAELYYYVDLSSGMGTYDVRPAWILTGSDKDGKCIQIIIDAKTAEEILP